MSGVEVVAVVQPCGRPIDRSSRVECLLLDALNSRYRPTGVIGYQEGNDSSAAAAVIGDWGLSDADGLQAAVHFFQEEVNLAAVAGTYECLLCRNPIALKSQF